MGAANDAGGATPSCRLDWLSVSAFAASEELQREQLACIKRISEHICPGAPWVQGSGRRFYANAVTCEESGIQLRWTEPWAGGNNAGGLNVDLTGRTLKLLTPAERVAVYLDLNEIEGFRQATRLDAQRTLIEPEADAEEIYDLVRDRQVWVPGYSAYSQLGAVDTKGDAVNGASVVWGRPSSARRCITYNKALEDRWEGVRAVRHEVRSRKALAKAGFSALVAEVEAASEPDGPEAEARLVQSILGQSMTYKDTSRLSAVRDKRDWPDNWAADSKPASFWEEVVTGTPIEVRPQWRITRSLEESFEAANNQYGRKLGMWELWQVFGLGKGLQEASQALMDQHVVRLRDEDLEGVLALLDEDGRARLRKEWDSLRQQAEERLAGATRQNPGPNDHG